MDCRFKFISGEWHPDLTRFMVNFVKNVDINLMMKGHVERIVESIPQAVGSETRTIVVFNRFSCQKLSSLDPIHQFPRSMAFICDFLDFIIEE